MKNILIAIGGFFNSLFKKVISGGDPTIIQLPENVQITPELVDHCINVVNFIKRVVNNPVMILITDLTPISLDNDIRLKISEALPAILAGLTYEKEALANTANHNDFVNNTLNKVRLSDDVDKNALYHALLARLIMVVSDGKVTWSEAVGFIELYFKQIFANPVYAPLAPATEVTSAPPVALGVPDASPAVDVFAAAIQQKMVSNISNNSLNK